MQRALGPQVGLALLLALSPAATGDVVPSRSGREADSIRAGLAAAVAGPFPRAAAGVPEQGGAAGGPGVVCAQAANPALCQLPDQDSARTSDFKTPFKVADRISNGTGVHVNITSLCWWGIYLDFTPAPDADCSADPANAVDAFTVTFFANDTSVCPNTISTTPVGGPWVQGANFSVSKAATGLQIGDFLEFEYTITLPSAVTVQPGDCVWVEIRNDTTGTVSDGCVWLWESLGAGTAVQDTNGDGDYNDIVDTIDADMSLCVNMTLGPQDACEPAVAPGCAGAAGDCGVVHGTPGCADPCCCSQVCAQLPTCCLSPWSQLCVDAALGIGCAVVPLCQAEANCQVYHNILALSSHTHPDAATNIKAADDFTVATNGNINTVCWQGVYGAGIGLQPNNFTVTYYADVNKFPGTVIASFNQAGGTLQGVTAVDTQLEIASAPPAPIFQYTATHANVAVTAGTCYWIEISNFMPDGQTWFWQAAQEGYTLNNLNDPTATRDGNGRMLQDGPPLDGYAGLADVVAGTDMAFCLGKVISAAPCNFATLFETGPQEPVLFNGAATLLFFSSGNLGGAIPQRRTAQAFTLPALPPGPYSDWSIEQILVEAHNFNAEGTVEFINFEIYFRTSLNVPPTPADLAAPILQIPDVPQQGITLEDGVLLDQGDITLPPGDYWLTFYGSNNSGVPPSDYAWAANAPFGVNNACLGLMGAGCNANPGCTGQPIGSLAMWRSCTYPVPGFQGYTLTPAVLSPDPNGDPTPDPADMMNCAFRIRGKAVQAGSPCVSCSFLPVQVFPAFGEAVVHVLAGLDNNASTDVAAVIPASIPATNGRVQVFHNLGDLLGQWQGLSSDPPIIVGIDPSGIDSGLFNAGTAQDLAVTNSGSNNVSILINQGNGTFNIFPSVPAGQGPSDAATADFDEDAFVDLAVTNELDNTVLIFLGNGDGTFTPLAGAGGAIPVGLRPMATMSGDFDNSKCPDLAGVSAGAALGLGSGSVFVLLGQNPGGFLGPFFYSTGNETTDLAIGDLDLDGFADIVATNMADDTVSVLLNAGDGTFLPATTLAVGDEPLSVAVFDLAGDDDLDLAVVATFASDRVVQVVENLLDLGGGLAFAPPFPLATGGNANHVEAGLINGDLLEDLVISNANDPPPGGSIAVILQAVPAIPCPWDCAQPPNGVIDTVDFLALLQNWGVAGGNGPCDFDSNGVIDTVDFLALLQHWGLCP